MAERGERDDGRGNRNPTLKSQAAIPKLADLGGDRRSNFPARKFAIDRRRRQSTW
jgi:hypothetical protein